MKPFIDQAFWSDPDIEGADAKVKLTALWLITNSQTNLLGVCGASESRFRFETGLDDNALSCALKALPRAFVRIGGVVFVRNYVRHQFGSGDKLKRNNFFVALKSLFLGIKDDRLREVILTEYPEFNEALIEGFEGLTKPKVSKGKEGEGSEKGSAEGKPSGFKVPACFESIDGFTVALADWIESRKKLKRAVTGKAVQLMLNKLAKRPTEAIAALEMCVEKGWLSMEWDWFDNAKGKPNGNGKVNGHGIQWSQSEEVHESPEDAARAQSFLSRQLEGED